MRLIVRLKNIKLNHTENSDTTNEENTTKQSIITSILIVLWHCYDLFLFLPIFASLSCLFFILNTFNSKCEVITEVLRTHTHTFNAQFIVMSSQYQLNKKRSGSNIKYRCNWMRMRIIFNKGHQANYNNVWMNCYKLYGATFCELRAGRPVVL